MGIEPISEEEIIFSLKASKEIFFWNAMSLNFGNSFSVKRDLHTDLKQNLKQILPETIIIKIGLRRR